MKDLENEMNILATFTCQLSACQKPITLRITGATYYRVSLNEHTILYGPARTAAGYASVDTLTLDVSKGGNLLIEVAGYNCRTLSNAFHSSILSSSGSDCRDCICELNMYLQVKNAWIKVKRTTTFHKVSMI